MKALFKFLDDNPRLNAALIVLCILVSGIDGPMA